MLPVDRGDGPSHDNDQTDGRQSRQETKQHRNAAKQFSPGHGNLLRDRHVRVPRRPAGLANQVHPVVDEDSRQAQAEQ